VSICTTAIPLCHATVTDRRRDVDVDVAAEVTVD